MGPAETASGGRRSGRGRVVVTGIGVRTPAGNTPDEMWDRLVSGRSTAAPISHWDPTAFPVRIACEVKGFDPAEAFGAKEARRLDRVTQLGLAAALDAIADAGDTGADPARSAVVLGTGVGGLMTLEEQVETRVTRGPERVSPFLVPMMMANATAAAVALRLGWTGPNLCVTTACAAGAHAVGEGVRLVRDGSADVVVVGGAEAAITPVAMAAFARMTALSGRNEEPEKASRPFDADRDGFVMGEGAAVLVLEPGERALARGARVYGEVAGYGRNADAYHITAPSPGGGGAAACMVLALADAGLEPGSIGHVNAHGTSTPLNDRAEAEALEKVFGGAPPPVIAPKGVTGHLIGAAGAAELVVSLLALRHGALPPTANFERRGEGIEIDVVAGAVRPLEPAPFLTNSFGFGGHNATLVVTPPAR